MSYQRSINGGMPVYTLAELDPLEIAAVQALRLAAKEMPDLDAAAQNTADRNLIEILDLWQTHGRRPLCSHAQDCPLVGMDEACFANLVAFATKGDNEDALLIATLLVKPSVAPILAACALCVGMALLQSNRKWPDTAAQNPRFLQ